MLVLNVAEQAGLEVAMQQIRNSEKLETIGYWGRVTGDTADYLIVAALSKGRPFPTKKFYYTTTRQPEKLSQMPDFDEECPLSYAPFTGEPSALVNEELREERRLARHVAAIDRDASLVPLGAYTVDSSHRVIKNPHFRGLSYEAAGSLKNFFHFRTPSTEAARSSLQKKGLVRPSDFLDPVDQFVSLDYAPDKTFVTIKNFYWPGAFFTHAVDTDQYDNHYHGDGIPNQDLPFML